MKGGNDMNIKRALLKDPPLPSLLADIREVCRQMELVNARFDMQSDSDLIDACIYEQEALRARYRYLLGQARQQGLSAPRVYEEAQTPEIAAALCPLPMGEQAV